MKTLFSTLLLFRCFMLSFQWELRWEFKVQGCHFSLKFGVLNNSSFIKRTNDLYYKADWDSPFHMESRIDCQVSLYTPCIQSLDTLHLCLDAVPAAAPR